MAAEFLGPGGGACRVYCDCPQPGFEGLTIAQVVPVADDGHGNLLEEVIYFYFARLVGEEDCGDPAAVLLP